MVDRFQYCYNGSPVAQFTSDGNLILHCTEAEFTQIADGCTDSAMRAYLRLLAVIAKLLKV